MSKRDKKHNTNKNILIINKNNASASEIRHCLTGPETNVFCAEDMNDALSYMMNTDFCLIILDADMPKQNETNLRKQAQMQDKMGARQYRGREKPQAWQRKESISKSTLSGSGQRPGAFRQQIFSFFRGGKSRRKNGDIKSLFPHTSRI